MKNYEMKSIDINSIVVWKDNPRHEKVNNESEAIKYLYMRVGKDKMNNLAIDICNEGLSPYDLPIIVKIDNDKRYYAYEGNRRMAVLKSILNPSFLLFDKSLYKKYKELNRLYKDVINRKVMCIVTDRDTAINEIEKIHQGEGNGVGRKPWGSFEKQMFNAIFKEKTSITVNIVNKINDNLKMNILDIIDATNIDRIFSTKEIKKEMNTEDYHDLSDQDIIIIKKLIETAVEESKKSNTALSRLFNNKKSINNYFIPLIKNLKDSDIIYNIRADDIIINQGGVFDFSMITYKIYDKENNLINVNEDELIVEYLDPKYNKCNTVDTSMNGVWKIIIKYKNTSVRTSLIIKEKVSPTLIIKKDEILVKYQETYNLMDNIKTAKDSLKNNVKDNVSITSIGDNILEIKNNIILNSNQLGEYKVKYEFYDENLETSISKVTNVFIREKNTIEAKKDNVHNILNSSVTKNIKIDISPTVNKLINQLSVLDIRKYDCVIATSLRALIELSVDEIISKYNIKIEYSKGKDKLLTRFEKVISEIKENKTLSNICVKYSSKCSYPTINNFLDILDCDKLLKSLNLGAHKSDKVLDQDHLKEIADKKIAQIIVLFHMYLHLND